VKTCFESAAYAVAQIRAILDLEEPGFKLRQVDGNSRAFMLGFQGDLPGNEREFILNLIYQTLSDGAGFVEGLTKQRIDELLHKIESDSFFRYRFF